MSFNVKKCDVSTSSTAKVKCLVNECFEELSETDAVIFTGLLSTTGPLEPVCFQKTVAEKIKEKGREEHMQVTNFEGGVCVVWAGSKYSVPWGIAPAGTGSVSEQRHFLDFVKKQLQSWQDRSKDGDESCPFCAHVAHKGFSFRHHEGWPRIRAEHPDKPAEHESTRKKRNRFRQRYRRGFYSICYCARYKSLAFHLQTKYHRSGSSGSWVEGKLECRGNRKMPWLYPAEWNVPTVSSNDPQKRLVFRACRPDEKPSTGIKANCPDSDTVSIRDHALLTSQCFALWIDCGMIAADRSHSSGSIDGFSYSFASRGEILVNYPPTGGGNRSISRCDFRAPFRPAIEDRESRSIGMMWSKIEPSQLSALSSMDPADAKHRPDRFQGLSILVFFVGPPEEPMVCLWRVQKG